jgi:hypothetical protein
MQRQQPIEMTTAEAECYDMFVMWKILHSPPAMPGQIAPEDKASMMTMLEWMNDNQRMQESIRDQKAEAARNRGSGAAGKHTTTKTQNVMG